MSRADAGRWYRRDINGYNWYRKQIQAERGNPRLLTKQQAFERTVTLEFP